MDWRSGVLPAAQKDGGELFTGERKDIIRSFSSNAGRNKKYLPSWFASHRQVDAGRRAVEWQLEGRVLVVDGGEAVRPGRWDGLAVAQEPIGLEDLTQVRSQAAAVVDHDAELLHLHTNQSINQSITSLPQLRDQFTQTSRRNTAGATCTKILPSMFSSL